MTAGRAGTHQDDPQQDSLDAALAASFPASDPPSMTTPAAATPAAGARSDDEQAAAGEDIVFLYRVVPADQSAHAFDPQPPYAAGRRWTSAETPAIYVSLSAGGALLEKLAHTEGASQEDLMLAVGAMPASLLAADIALPKDWKALPYRPEVQETGDRWLAAHEHLGIVLPSALIERERNVLIDAAHPDISRVVLIEALPLPIDARLRH